MDQASRQEAKPPLGSHHTSLRATVFGKDTLKIGDAAPTFVYEVTAEAIAQFCRSARYENLVYTNQPAAQERGLPGIVAPPAMALAYAPVRVSQLLRDAGVSGFGSGELPDGAAPRVKLEIEFQGSLVVPGDLISSVTSVRDKGEEDEGRYLTLEVIARNQRGELVARIGCTYRWLPESSKNN
jgi:acyl dehydratase